MMDSVLRRGNPHEKTREKTRVKPREKAPTRVVIGKFWARGNSVNNAARARPCAAGDAPMQAGTRLSGLTTSTTITMCASSTGKEDGPRRQGIHRQAL